MRKLNLLSPLVLLIFIACTSTFRLYEIEQLTPPENPLPKYLHRLAVIQPAINEVRDSVDLKISSVLTSSLVYYLGESPFIDTVIVMKALDTQFYLKDTNNWPKLEKISLDSNIDGFISFDIRHRVFEFNSMIETNLDDWGNNFTETQYLDFTSKLYLDIILSDPYFRRVQMEQYAKKCEWSEEVYTDSHLKAAISDSTWSFQYLADEIGKKYATGRTPYWQTDYRRWYSGRSSLMKKAFKLVQDGNFNESVEIWETVAAGDFKADEKAQALINLALYAEINDNIDKALNYTLKAMKLSNDLYTQDLLRALQNRQEKVKDLNKMFGR